MNIRQRQQETKSTSIEGRKINNNVRYIKKQIRTLSPQLYQPIIRQQTFETDSFKEILTRRSGGHMASKENISMNHKNIRKAKQSEVVPPDENNKKNGNKQKKSTDKKKHSTSTHKFIHRQKSSSRYDNIRLQRKSYSPIRDHKQYKSGPTDKRNYVSNNNISSKTSRDMIQASKSQKNLTDRIRNPLQTFFTKSVKNPKKSKQHIDPHSHNSTTNRKKVKPKKPIKNSSSTTNIIKKKKNSSSSKIQELAKQFDSLLERDAKIKNKIPNNKNSPPKKKKKKSGKHVIISNNNSLSGLTNQKNKIIHISEYSSDSSPQRNQLLEHRYEKQSPNKKISKKKNGRHSFQPVTTHNKYKKQMNKVKTQEYSPQKLVIQEINRNQAAIVLQKNIKGFLDRRKIIKNKKNLQNTQKCQRYLKTFLTIRNYQTNLQKNQRRQNIIENVLKMGSILDKHEHDKTIQHNQLIDLLESILQQEKISLKVKFKIQDFLSVQKSAKNSARSSLNSHSEQQMMSQRRFLEKQMNKINKNNYLLSPQQAKVLSNSHYKNSPMLDKQYLTKSPKMIIENLQAIKQIQRQKIIIYANYQRQGVDNLALKNVFSPNTQTLKKKQIEQKMNQQLQKFDRSIEQVIKITTKTQEMNQVKPFQGILTPQKHQKSVSSHQNLSSERFQDQSMELLEYYQQITQLKTQQQYQPLDNTFDFIDQYLLNFPQFLRQKGQTNIQDFIKALKSPKNIRPQILLRNLQLVTEDSNDQMGFILPMYKYLQNQQNQLITMQMAQQFNQQYIKLKRHHINSSKQSIQLEQIYLKMIIDCANEAFNEQRPIRYIFTETSVLHQTDKKLQIEMKQMYRSSQNIDIDNNSQVSQIVRSNYNQNQKQFQLYFAKAMNQIYRWAHFEAGLKPNNQIDEQTVTMLNQKKYQDLLLQQSSKKWQSYDELLQIIAGLQVLVSEHLLLESIYEIQFIRA